MLYLNNKNNMSPFVKWFVSLAILVMLLPIKAQAQLIQNMFIDTKAMSLGNAVTADPTGIMDIHFNPAGLTKLDGRQMQFQFMNIVLQSEATFSLPKNYDSTGELLDISKDPILAQGKSKSSAAAYLPGVGILPMDTLPVLTLPNGGVSINPLGSRFTFANATYAPMASGFSKPENDSGRYQARQVALQRFTYLAPSFGYKISDTLSVGASFLFSHQAVAVEQNIRAPSSLIAVLSEIQKSVGCFDDNGNPTGSEPLLPLVAFCGGEVGPYKDVGNLKMSTEETLSPSYNLGFLWEPVSWFAFGVGYQSEAESHLSGTYELNYADGFANFFKKFSSTIVGTFGSALMKLPTGLDVEKGHLTTKIIYPQHLQIGTKFRIFDTLQLNIDAGWTDFAKWDALEFKFDREVSFLNAAKTLAPGLATGSSLRQPLNYKSVWSFGFGMQLDVSSRLSLRAGYEPRQTSIPTDGRSVQAPLGFAELYSVGLGYQWDRSTVIDLSASFMESKEEILADSQADSRNGKYPNSSNAVNRNCLTCTVTNPYPGLDIKTKLTIGAIGFSFRTKF